MKQLTAAKKRKLLSALKKYRRKYLTGKYTEVDESATRLMTNEFLTECLGFVPLDEVKTEYMIRGSYADYVIQIKGKRHFIIEVKKMPLELAFKHLRQAVNYAANEGVDWVLLTNGKVFEFYRVLFNKPIESRKVFSFDLSNKTSLKNAAENLQYLTRALVPKRGLDGLWNRFSALDANSLSRLLYSKKIINHLRRELKRRYKTRFTDEDICASMTRIIEDAIEHVQPKRERRKRRSKRDKFKGSVQSIAVPLAANSAELQ
ncbi:MAG: type I restriction enzyme HsdR N-terminal domain-containing protein [Candidatus Omnitrophica bacterium]|nr:type I restriction enzyme HsdR N-terminal domain-containing protein [Candidatus Omnitrophota bacterium]